MTYTFCWFITSITVDADRQPHEEGQQGEVQKGPGHGSFYPCGAEVHYPPSHNLPTSLKFPACAFGTPIVASSIMAGMISMN